MTSVYWHLPPLILAVSLVYAGTRHERWSLILLRTLTWTRYIVGFLGTVFLVIEGVVYFQKDWWKPALALAAIWFVYTRFVRRPKPTV